MRSIILIFLVGSFTQMALGQSVNDITFDQFVRAVTSNPAGEPGNWPSPSREKYDSFMRSASPRGLIQTKVEAAMALANLLHESDGLRAKEEYACKDNPPVCPYKDPGCDVPGKYYHGRGYIQLTWCYNYRTISQDLFGDDRLVNDPDSVTGEQLAWDTAFSFWKINVHYDPQVQQEKFGATIRRINGGIECSSPGHPSAERRKRIYVAVREAFGLPGPGDHSGC